MDHRNRKYRVGRATITRIDETELPPVSPASLFPHSPAEMWQPHLHRFGPGSVEPETGFLHRRIHAWLVRTPDRVVLVDAATGNNKERPTAPLLHRLDTGFLRRLQDAGVRSDAVDAVLITHLHADHVGWNTSREDGGAWQPVFPHARHVFSRIEAQYAERLDRGEKPDPADLAPGLGGMARRPLAGVYADSVAPIIAAGLADPISVDGCTPVPGFTFLSSPGHSIDHASILFRSEGEEALFAGDLFHHPIQVLAPQLNSNFCEFPEAAERSRRRLLAMAADRDLPVFTTHCTESSVGRVGRTETGYGWSYE